MSRGANAGLLGVAAVAVLAATLLWGRGSGPAPEAAPPVAAPVEEVAQQAPAAPEPAPVVDLDDLSIESGGILELEAASLPEGAPLVVDLKIPPEAGAAPELPVRVLSGADGRQLETTGTVGPDGASVEIDTAFLSPGRYLVELKTTEQNHFPLRRYVIAVR